MSSGKRICIPCQSQVKYYPTMVILQKLSKPQSLISASRLHAQVRKQCFCSILNTMFNFNHSSPFLKTCQLVWFKVKDKLAWRQIIWILYCMVSKRKKKDGDWINYHFILTYSLVRRFPRIKKSSLVIHYKNKIMSMNKFRKNIVRYIDLSVFKTIERIREHNFPSQ